MLTKQKAVVLYVLFSIVWIVATDLCLQWLSFDRLTQMTVSIGKGGIFVVLSAAFLYQMLKKTEQLKKTAEEEQQLSTLINSMPDFVCFKDHKGRWLRVNDFGRKLYHLEEVDYVGKTDLDLGEVVPFFKDTFAYCAKTDEEAWQKGEMTRAEESFATPNGDMKTFDVIKVPLFDERGERKGLLTIGRDITQQKLAETLLLKKEKLSVLGELAAGIAHEIRNPLTSIKGFIQVMKETKTTNDWYLAIVLNELERIDQIVSELLVLAKPQSQCYKPFLLKDAIDYVVHLIIHEATLNNVEMTIDNEAADATVYGDKNQIIQVLINIMKNAIEAMPKEGALRVRIWEGEGEIRMSFADTGIGISKERLAKIGEPFFTLKEKGMGLGLTTSMKIIQEHKGTLKIESELGKGTTVYLSLPVHEQAKGADG